MSTSKWSGDVISVVASDSRMPGIVYEGRLVALAGATRCYVLVDDLGPGERRLIAAVWLCSREIRAGRLPGPFTGEPAERWARALLRGADERTRD